MEPQGIIPAPVLERIPSIPELSGAYRTFFMELKEVAVKHSLRLAGITDPRPTRKRVSTKPLSPYQAFCWYYRREFYATQIQIAQTLLGYAWELCPHQSIWEFYATQYSRYQREKPFLDWLEETPKEDFKDTCIFIFEDPRVFGEKAVEVREKLAQM